MFYSYTCTPIYESTAKILLLPRTSEGAVISTGKSEKRVFSVSSKDVNTEMELIYSNKVMEDTVKSFGEKGMELKGGKKSIFASLGNLGKMFFNKILILIGLKPQLSPFDQKVEYLKNSLDVNFNNDSNILFVTLRAENPKAAAIVLNKLLGIYIKHHDRVFTKEGGIRFYNDQAEKFNKKLEDAERKLKEFQKNNGIIELKAQNDANISLMADLNQVLKKIEISYDERKSKINLFKKALAKNANEILITKEMRTIPSIVTLEESIVPLMVRRSEIEKSFTTQSREYRDMENQIHSLRNDVIKEVERAIKIDELELQSMETKKKSLLKKITQLKAKAIDLDQKERQLRELQRQVELYSNNYMLYASKTEDARIYSERAKRNLANVSIADMAAVPVQPVFPKRILMLFLSIIFGLIAALCLPFILEAMDRKLKTASDTEELLSLPVICSFPEIQQ